MTIIKRIRYLGNSPTHERDLATMFTPIRLGVWFLFLNATLLIAIGGVFWVMSESTASQWRGGMSGSDSFQSVGLSDVLTSIIFLSLSAFITIFVPIRVVGPIMGPRVGRYFDQIVLSGISPLRYFSGKVLSQNVFLAVIAMAAMPYLVLCVSLGGISAKYALLGVFVLAVYANILALTTLLLSVFAGEIASIAITLVGFSVAFMSGLIPMVPNPTPISPSAVFLSPLAQLMWPGQIGRIIPLQGITQEQLQLIIFLTTSAVIAFISIVWLVLGPLNCILQENGTFGEVVLKGDSKKRGFMKRRMMLRLRSEISFFYENRAPWLKRWDFILRWGLAEGLFLLALILPFGLLVLVPAMGLSSGASGDDKAMVALAFAIGLVWVFLNNALFLKDLTTERLRHRGIEAGHVDLLFYFVNLAMIAAGVSLFLSMAGDAMDKQWEMVSRWQVSQGGVSAAPPVWHLPGTTVGLCLFVFGFELHWFTRWLSIRMWSRLSALVLACIIFVAVTSFLPWVQFLLIKEGNIAGLPAWLNTLAPIIADLSFTTAPFYCIKDYPYRDLANLGKEGLHLMLGFHFSFALLWMLAFFRIRKGLTVRDLN
ncbi:MAG: hypothetical protein KDN22_10205 [Verrucomicrobiae bacterium]|nr:hypothetical protein [Verrucomicrobiae bacterium]